MAGVPIKFRCYRCNQLLGVSRSKVGSVVACPKCASELLVPEPEDVIATADPATPSELPIGVGRAASPETIPSFLSSLTGEIPVELAEIRPEDIRVEPSVTWSPPPQPQPPPIPAPPPNAFSVVPDVVSPPPVAVQTPIPPPPKSEPLVPPINLESQRLIAERTTTVRARDLILPRSVVAFWSLFVLLAQALAFVAGLLAGHFIWRIH
jgi:DNA-directed RNA polymerase subunit RPC12/RpoP